MAWTLSAFAGVRRGGCRTFAAAPGWPATSKTSPSPPRPRRAPRATGRPCPSTSPVTGDHHEALVVVPGAVHVLGGEEPFRQGGVERRAAELRQEGVEER